MLNPKTVIEESVLSWANGRIGTLSSSQIEDCLSLASAIAAALAPMLNPKPSAPPGPPEPPLPIPPLVESDPEPSALRTYAEPTPRSAVVDYYSGLCTCRTCRASEKADSKEPF